MADSRTPMDRKAALSRVHSRARQRLKERHEAEYAELMAEERRKEGLADE